MIIVIDGYNVLRAAFPGPHTTSNQKEYFVKQLGVYAKQKGHKIVLVFDGGSNDRSTKMREHGVYVVYSGYRESADDYIKRYVEDHKAEDLLLASSDREIRDAASRVGIESVGGFSFYKKLQAYFEKTLAQQGEQSGKSIKITDDAHPELDALMEESGTVHSKVEDEQVGHSRKSASTKLSKKERKLSKKIKKL